MRRRLALLILAGLAAGVAAFAPVPVYKPKRPESRAAMVVRALEAIRVKMPPAVGMGEHNGMSVKESEPFLLTHLSGVARRLGVKTKAECIALLPYIRDRDFKVRYIAIQAIEGTTRAFPGGMSITWCTDIHSAGHQQMAVRFLELIGQLED